MTIMGRRARVEAGVQRAEGGSAPAASAPGLQLRSMPQWKDEHSPSLYVSLNVPTLDLEYSLRVPLKEEEDPAAPLRRSGGAAAGPGGSSGSTSLFASLVLQEIVGTVISKLNLRGIRARAYDKSHEKDMHRLERRLGQEWENQCLQREIFETMSIEYKRAATIVETLKQQYYKELTHLREQLHQAAEAVREKHWKEGEPYERPKPFTPAKVTFIDFGEFAMPTWEVLVGRARREHEEKQKLSSKSPEPMPEEDYGSQKNQNG